MQNASAPPTPAPSLEDTEVDRIVRSLQAELKKTQRKRWVRIGITIGVLVAGYVGFREYQRRNQPPPEPRFTGAPVEVRDIVEKVQATGVVEPLTKLEVGTQVSGRIAKVYVDFNDVVKEGDLLAEIDPQIPAAQLVQSQAELAARQAALERAKTARDAASIRLQRIKTLVPEGLASPAELDQAQADLDMAKAEVASAEANVGQVRAMVQSAGTTLKYTKIVTAIDGVVIDRQVEPGQTVAASFNTPVLFVIARDLEQMRVLAEIDEADVGKVKEGMQASIVVDAFPTDRFQGKLTQIRLSPNTVEGVVTYSAVVVVDNPELKLRPGMTANVTIETASARQVVAVPTAALRFEPLRTGPADQGAAPAAPAPVPLAPLGPDEGRAYLLKGAGAAQTIEPLTLKIGLSDGVYATVLSPLEAGSLVVVDEKPTEQKRGFRLF
jgi:HlyD family secretion protein